jgi:hypothetical protein
MDDDSGYKKHYDKDGNIIDTDGHTLTLAEQRIEAAIAEQMPNSPVIILIHSLGYRNVATNDFPEDWIGINNNATNYYCFVPFGICRWSGVNMTTATLRADQVPTKWKTPGHGLPYNTEHWARIVGTDPRIKRLIYNRCETYYDPNLGNPASRRACDSAGGSCCGVLVAEGWFPYTPLTPVADMIGGLVNIFGTIDRSDPSGRVTHGSPLMQRHHEIYFAIIL